MTDSDLVAQLRRRLSAPRPDHQSFVGAPFEIAGLTPIGLGSLWVLIQRAIRGDNPATNQAAWLIVRQAEEQGLQPVLDGATCIEAMQAIAPGSFGDAVKTLSYLNGEPSAALATEARRVLGDAPSWKQNRYQAAVLARLVDAPTFAAVRQLLNQEFADSPYVLKELEVLEHLSFSALLSLALPSYIGYFSRGDERRPDPAEALASEAAYIDFAAVTLKEAERRLRDIHEGRTPYVADGAFTTHDSQVIACAARVASLRDEVWFGEIILSLLPKSAVAPSKANTTPAQSLAIALGHTIEAVPTVESVEALRVALGVVRHASVKKKLSRNLKPAERALAERPEMALRVTLEPKADKRRHAILAACLEAGLWQSLELPFEDWRARLADTEIGAPFAHGLIWNVRDAAGRSVSVLSDGARGHARLIGRDGKVVEIEKGSRFSPWHPLATDDAERGAWQGLIHERQIRQPIRQVFREHYPRPAGQLSSVESRMFSGHVLSLVPLIGLARREGWSIDKFDGLIRAFGDVRVRFLVDADLYPGVEGEGESKTMRFEKRDGRRWAPVSVGDVPPIVFSEMCRAVDLLVSVSSLGLGASSLPAASSSPADMLQMRRQILRRILARHVAEGTLAIEDRHLKVGAHAIHLTTGRITRDGVPVEISRPTPEPGSVVIWMPHEDALLQKIVGNVQVLLAT